jgi:protein AATF/BFR2
MLQSDTEGSCGRFLLPAAADAAAASDSNDEDDDVHNNTNNTNSSSSRASRWRSDPVDTEVLDDRELYQHLLKEFVEGGAAGSSAVASARLRQRQRKRRRVDTRASKGRKLRYEPHPKLQNFTFPQEYGASPMDADELFASLFGQSRSRSSAAVRSSSSGGGD